MSNSQGLGGVLLLLCPCFLVIGGLWLFRFYMHKRNQGQEAWATHLQAAVSAAPAAIASAIRARIEKGNNKNVTAKLDLKRFSDYGLVYAYGNFARTDWQFKVDLDGDEQGSEVEAYISSQSVMRKGEGAAIALRLFEDVQAAILSIDPQAKIRM